ncbi:hypothetical protein O3M35_002591 [Rhynocoris fuscipes]|uniref:Transmembrane protein n=1 Tax=Rhynocoris fuscipes TaxID=488301 RepID=A0AAW1CPY5_9HEMI
MYTDQNYIKIAKQLSMWYYETNMLLITMQFCIALNAISLQINNLRLNYLKIVNSKLNFAIDREDNLIKISLLINDNYGKQILISCAHILFTTISFLFHIAGHIAKNNINYSKEIQLSLNVLWQLSKLYCICEVCHEVNTQENIITCKLRKPGVKFTACGLFGLGFPLFTSCSSTCKLKLKLNEFLKL